MKVDAPKRKIFSDAVDLLAGDPPASVATGNGIEMLDIDCIRPFHNHPFHLYEGERLDDMVESIKEHGILTPVIVRKMHYGYEMLSGHNRQSAGKLAGLKQIPAIVKKNLSDQDAYIYVIETNLMQRSFTDLSITEKAAVLAERYDKVLYQRKDGTAYYVINNNMGYDGDLELAMIPESFRTDALNEVLDDNNVLIENADSELNAFALLFEFDGDIKHIRHVLYNCSASRPGIEGQTNEESREVQTETLTIKATPLASGVVKAKTGNSTDATVYADWYTAVYMPTITADKASVAAE